MLQAIAMAQTRVWCESYIFDNSHVAATFFTALRDAALRGLDVVLLVDYIGSFSLRNEWVRELRSVGADVVFFNPVLPSNYCVGPLSFRDHRKIMVCDDLGFCGGMNIQEEVGEEEFGTSRFYDVHSKLEGPCVADLAEEPGVYVQILQSNVRQRRRTLQKVIEKSIDAADDSVLLTTAYFFPPGFLKNALLRVPARGARLSLLLSGSSDFYPLPGDLLAQTHFLRNFLRDTPSQQVKVHLYGHRHMHAKHMCVDGVFSTIGSFNFDLYSARRNLEVGVAVFDRDFARKMQRPGRDVGGRNLHLKRAGESKQTFYSCLSPQLEEGPEGMRGGGDSMYHQPLVRCACALAYGLEWDFAIVVAVGNDRLRSLSAAELDSEGDDDEVPAHGCCPRARKQAPKFLRPPRTAEDNLRKASADGAVSTVQALLASRVQATAATENGYTALHAAAAHGRSKIVPMLLNAEAQVDCTASGGVTPLMLAAMGGHKATLEALLSARASLHEELRGARGQERQAVHLADLFGHAQAAELLKQHLPRPSTSDGAKKPKDRKQKKDKTKK
ncbi:clsB, partial [Symbiodinium sp. CCMP2456]